MYSTNYFYIQQLFMYSTDELIIIYTFSESEIFFPVFKIQSLQFFKKNVSFRRPKILLRKDFIVWYSNRINFFKMDVRTFYLIFAKCLSCLNYVELWLNFLWYRELFTLLLSVAYLSEKNWNGRNIILWVSEI